jgi:hypothetical protein
LNATIFSLNYPNNFSENLNCIWNISVPQRYKIKLQFKELKTKAFSDCVEVFDGNSVDYKNSIGKFCGSAIPYKLISTYTNLTIKFSAHKSINNNGFVAEYEVQEISIFLKIFS